MAHLHALWQQANLQASRREWANAHASFIAVLQLQPNHAGALLQLSQIESVFGHYLKAREYALRAHSAKPRETVVIQELITRLRAFNEPVAIHECLSRLPPLEQIDIPLLMHCGAQLSYLNEQDRALQFFDEAKRADPNYPLTLMARGQVLIYLGRFQEAEADLQRCASLAPEISQAYWLLSKLRTQTLESNHIEAIGRQLGNPRKSHVEVAQLEYALHKELDDLGDYAGAWDALGKACGAKRSTLDYDSDDSRDLISKLMQLPGSMQSLGGKSAVVRRTPIFIVGMHRSGTTLLEHLLDGHSEVRGVGELYDFPSQMRYATDHHCRGVIDGTIVERSHDVDLLAVGERYMQGIEWRLGAEPCFTDKLPSNFLNIGFICRAMPEAKILHMVRDPIETCFSNLRELFSGANAYSYDQIELADFFLQYQRLMRHWHATFPGRILNVDYAELTREPQLAMQNVTRFCGLQFESGMLDTSLRTRGVATASAVQVREKVIIREKPKWVPYAAYLQPLIHHLESGEAWS